MNSDVIWLVKSADKIRGPFRAVEVMELLRKKEIVGFDETITPNTRWRLIRDEPIYSDIVEEIRRGHLTAREDTEVQSTTGSVTVSTTDVVTNNERSLTPKSLSKKVSKQDTRDQMNDSRITDADFVDIVPTRPERSKSNAVHGAQRQSGEGRNQTFKDEVRQFGIEGSNYRGRQTSGLTKFVWLMAIAVVAIAVIMLLNSQKPDVDKKSMQIMTQAQLLEHANRAWDQGDFKKSAEFYGRIDRARPRQPEIVTRLAPVLIQHESATVRAKRMLLDTLHSLPKDQVGPRAHLEAALGLAALVGGDLNEADARYKAAKLLQPGSAPAMFGSAVVQFLLKNYLEASRLFLFISDEPAAQVFAVRSLLMIEGANRQQRLSVASGILKKVMQSTQDFRQESLIMAAGIDLEQGNKKAAIQAVRLALDTDPQLTSDHRHDPMFFLDPLGWRELKPTCQKLSNELKSPAARALFGLCAFKAGDNEEANRILKLGLAEAPEDTNLQALDAFILFSSGRMEDALAVVNLTSKSMSPPPLLTKLVQTRICAIGSGSSSVDGAGARTKSDQEMTCAEREWRALSLQSPPVLASLIGLAETLDRQGDARGAQELVSKVKKISSNYRPALTFRESELAQELIK